MLRTGATVVVVLVVFTDADGQIAVEILGMHAARPAEHGGGWMLLLEGRKQWLLVAHRHLERLVVAAAMARLERAERRLPRRTMGMSEPWKARSVKAGPRDLR